MPKLFVFVFVELLTLDVDCHWRPSSLRSRRNAGREGWRNFTIYFGQLWARRDKAPSGATSDLRAVPR